MNILIAEDETITRKRLQHFLEKWGYRVIETVANIRTRATRIPYGDQAIFIRDRCPICVIFRIQDSAAGIRLRKRDFR